MNAAATALGGKDKIEAVHSLIIEGAGNEPDLGQNVTPEAPLPVWKLISYKRTIDPVNGRMRIEQSRVPQFPSPDEGAVSSNMNLDGDAAWDVTGNVPGDRLTDAAAYDRRMEMLHYPVTILRAALDPKAMLSDYQKSGDVESVDITTAMGDMLRLEMDAATHLPLRVTSMTDQPNLGDVAVETTFEDYALVDGLQLPRHLTTKIDKWVQSDIRVSRTTVNGNAPDLSAPASVKAEIAAPAVPAVNVTAEQVAPGIWWLAGSGKGHSVLFEFSDHLTLFELPDNETRARAVIDKAHSIVFGKPLTQVIISHHHFDDSAGLRAAVAEGLTIITQSGNAAFFKDLVARRHSIAPDELAKQVATEPLNIKTVDDSLVLKDDMMELDLYHVKGNSHSSTLLMGWAPAAHILVQADLYNSNWKRFPWAANLKENVALRGLKVEKDVPIHGDIETWPEVLTRMDGK